MTEPTPPGHRDADERIGAWLDGELTGADAEAFEAELAADAQLAARVEAIRAVRERLAGSNAPAPTGFTERIGRAVATEAGTGPAETASLAEVRARREQRRKRLLVLGSAAAALVVVAAVAPIVTELLPRPQEDAAEVAGSGSDGSAREPEPEAADDDAERFSGSELDNEAADMADEEADGAVSAHTSAGEVPLVVDDQTVFTSPSTLLEHFRDRPEAVELVGAPPGQARALAERTRAALDDAAAFDDATSPDACATEIAADVDGPAVFARVERVILDGEPLTAHLVVTGPPGRPLEAIRLHVLDPDVDCADRMTERLR